MKSKVVKIAAIVLPILVLISCTKDDDNDNIIEGTNSIVDYLDASPDYSIFRKAIDRAGMSPVLQGNSGSFTVFAPDDSAFEAYFQENQLDSLVDLSQQQVEQLVNYHILLTLNNANSFSTSYLKTRAKVAVNDSTDTRMSLLVERKQDSLIQLNDQSTVSEADIPVDNGILHKVDAVFALPTLATFMQADDNLNAFYEQLTTETSDQTLESWIADTTGVKKTLFVPSEDAVSSYLSNQNEISPNTLRNHFMDSIALSSSFTLGYTATMATKSINGDNAQVDLYVDNQTGLKLNGQAGVSVSDIVGVNGVLHVTDKLVQLPTVADFVRADIRLKSLQNAIELDQFSDEAYYDLLSDTNSTAPFTVFAPNTTAFDQFLAEAFPEMDASLINIPEQELKEILETHIITQNQITAPLDNQSINSFNNQTLMLDGLQISGGNNNTEANLTTFNAQAINGVLHRVDAVVN